ncbi:MAG TPA: LPS export ABC transporter permease LptG [Gammaproteobacteria bacterium]|nr:LPS export ABC transporter permease LptG [Gammaproteobacteria bacterium]
MVLDRYIARAVFSGALLACFVMLSIFVFIDFVNQLKSVGTGDYGVMQAAVFVLLKLPQRLYELSPSILLLGGILSLGTLAANSELIVMRASGISPMRITRSVLQAGLLVALLVAVIGEYIAPSATRIAKNYRAQAMEKKLLVAGMNDVWARDGNRYVNVKKILPNHRLQHVRVYEMDNNYRLSSIIYARGAQFRDKQWHLRNLKRSTISAEGVTVQRQKKMVMDRLILLELFTVLELESYDMSASELYAYSRYLEDNNLDSREYLLAFWIKVFTPLTCLVMLFIAMPIVFATTPRSGGMGQRVILAVLIGVIYYVVNRSFNHLGVALDFSPLLSAAVPLLLVLGAGYFFMKKVA